MFYIDLEKRYLAHLVWVEVDSEFAAKLTLFVWIFHGTFSSHWKEILEKHSKLRDEKSHESYGL